MDSYLGSISNLSAVDDLRRRVEVLEDIVIKQHHCSICCDAEHDHENSDVTKCPKTKVDEPNAATLRPCIKCGTPQPFVDFGMAEYTRGYLQAEKDSAAQEKEIEATKPKPWEPEANEDFFYINAYGAVENSSYDEDRKHFWKQIVLGIYRTRKAAEEARDKIAAYVKTLRR